MYTSFERPFPGRSWNYGGGCPTSVSTLPRISWQGRAAGGNNLLLTLTGGLPSTNVFLIFDVEMAFLLPWAVAFRSPELAALYGPLAFWDAVVFVAILVVGLVYLWARGDLRWVRPQPQIDKKEPTERERRERDMLLGKAV